jgi:hypothetical protein
MRGCCLCGEIEFEILGRLPKLYQCHCGLCRKQSGGASNAATVVDAHQMSSIKGAEVIRTWRKNTGFRSDFCVNCGSPVLTSRWSRRLRAARSGAAQRRVRC